MGRLGIQWWCSKVVISIDTVRLRLSSLIASRPNHFFEVSKAVGSSVIKDLYIQNYPVHCFSISGSNGLLLDNIILNNTAGAIPNANSSGLAAAHNTDGFDISSTDGLTLRNSTVLNQDDCVAVTSGNDIVVQDMYCDGELNASKVYC